LLASQKRPLKQQIHQHQQPQSIITTTNNNNNQPTNNNTTITEYNYEAATLFTEA